MRAHGLLVGLLAVPLLGACIPSNVVGVDQRRVIPSLEELTWSGPLPEDVPGYYRSETVEGPMASVVRVLYYLFERDGTYTGAALLGGGTPRFQVLTGTWTLEGEDLRLDQAPPARLRVAEERLELVGGEGRVVLRREPTP